MSNEIINNSHPTQILQPFRRWLSSLKKSEILVDNIKQRLPSFKYKLGEKALSNEE